MSGSLCISPSRRYTREEGKSFHCLPSMKPLEARNKHMNDNLDSTVGQSPKNSADITEAHIRREAILCTKKHGWEISPGDCRIERVTPPYIQLVEVGLGFSTESLLPTEWDVYITPRVPPNPRRAHLRVHVEYNQGFISDLYVDGLLEQ
jgi:hypothetical protein